MYCFIAIEKFAWIYIMPLIRLRAHEASVFLHSFDHSFSTHLLNPSVCQVWRVTVPWCPVQGQAYSKHLVRNSWLTMLFLVWAAELDQYVFQDTQLEGLSKDIFSKLTSSCCLFNFLFYISFPAGLASKESACDAGDLGLIPGLGRSPGEENGYPLQYSCLENSMERGAWWATVHGVAELDATERLSLSLCRLEYSWLTMLW